MEEQVKQTNRLINETSPYLLAHAHNPVDWLPWGKDAFDQAADEESLFLFPSAIPPAIGAM